MGESTLNGLPVNDNNDRLRYATTVMKVWLDLVEKVQQLRTKHPYVPGVQPLFFDSPGKGWNLGISDIKRTNAIAYTPFIALDIQAKNMVYGYLRAMFREAQDRFNIDLGFDEWYKLNKDEQKWRVLLDKAVAYINKTVTHQLISIDEEA